jgi:tetratricopeptide (TPR) repeat protein
MNWSDLVPKPRPLPESSGPFGDPPFEWDVFISYRSTNRVWAISLYDQLVAANFRVFLDQFVLRPGIDLGSSLSDVLNKSASGVLVLSRDVEGADWVRSEYTKMRELRERRGGTSLPFNYVIARIDDSKLPFEDQKALYVDFSQGYEDGPRGSGLVRLVHGLVGEPLPDKTVRAALQVDEKVKELLIEIDALHTNGDHDAMVALLQSDREELRESPNIAATGAERLISANHVEQALSVVRSAQGFFPRSLRLRQLEGLALRRLAQREEDPERRLQLIRASQGVLGRLYAAKHRDPETLGIYAATWWMRYELSKDRSFLERSRTLYAEAFELTPKDEYVGINAASKSALLGDLDLAKQLAERVGRLTNAFADGSEFYKAFSLAEALLLLGRYDEAATIYQKACRKHPNRRGDVDGARIQMDALIAALDVPEAAASKLRQALQG